LNEDSESIKEEKNDLELEFSVDDNMISKTENERLEAWKFFRPRNLEERGIPDEITSTPYSSSKTPHPSSRIDPDELHRHDVVYTKSGKRISLPLPGWMEDFQSKNRPRPSSTNTSVRYASARSRCVSFSRLTHKSKVKPSTKHTKRWTWKHNVPTFLQNRNL
jgi:hypothetical protein